MERKFFFSFPAPSGPLNVVDLVEEFEGVREAVS